MSDETPSPPPDRDPELATALAVPPLDGTTRRALVRTALEESTTDTRDDTDPGLVAADDRGERRLGRLSAALGVAAALVIGAVIGAVIVTRPEDQPFPTAAVAPSTAIGDQRAKGASPDVARDQESSAEAPAAAPAPAVELGDLGAVNGPAGIRAAINRRLEAGTDGTPASVACPGYGPGGAAGIYGLVVITAAGTATLDGDGVAILVGPRSDGHNVAVVLDPSRGCEFIRFVEL